jgi:hypothetical protein
MALCIQAPVPRLKGIGPCSINWSSSILSILLIYSTIRNSISHGNSLLAGVRNHLPGLPNLVPLFRSMTMSAVSSRISRQVVLMLRFRNKVLFQVAQLGLYWPCRKYYLV